MRQHRGKMSFPHSVGCWSLCWQRVLTRQAQWGQYNLRNLRVLLVWQFESNVCCVQRHYLWWWFSTGQSGEHKNYYVEKSCKYKLFREFSKLLRNTASIWLYEHDSLQRCLGYLKSSSTKQSVLLFSPERTVFIYDCIWPISECTQDGCAGV